MRSSGDSCMGVPHCHEGCNVLCGAMGGHHDKGCPRCHGVFNRHDKRVPFGQGGSNAPRCPRRRRTQRNRPAVLAGRVLLPCPCCRELSPWPFQVRRPFAVACVPVPAAHDSDVRHHAPTDVQEARSAIFGRRTCQESCRRTKQHRGRLRGCPPWQVWRRGFVLRLYYF